MNTESASAGYENPDFLTTQIITYIGNKRTLIYDIEKELLGIKEEMGKDRLVTADLFSGSGIVARMLKQHSSHLIVNDLELYSAVLNSCYLTNVTEFDREKYTSYKAEIDRRMSGTLPYEGIITTHYAPADDTHIQKGERAFYTRENALRIDTYRHLIDEVVTDEACKRFFLAPLITEASVHVNTSGVFKGFYKDKNTGLGCFGGTAKNALSRILGRVTLSEPVFSRYFSDIELYQEDTIALSKMLSGIDVAYLDPPYNQHPYGSNYFMLNLIIKNRIDCPISRVSGITSDWNRSAFNKAHSAFAALEQTVASLDAKYCIISYNSEGFISFKEMKDMLSRYGSVKTVELPYNTFRGSRNLRQRAIHVSEYLFVLKKK